ncbi:ATP-binding cassette domain-containing protein [Klebsiella pneumoniae]
MLQVSQLHQYYGGSHILRGVDFSARQGEVTCLLGRNGVGKTTLLKCLMGLIPARSGEVRWQDQNITHRKPHQRVQAGVAYVPQGREIFPRLTVEENLLVEQFYDFAAGLADHYLVMSRGAIVQQGKGGDMESDGVRAMVTI